MGKTNDLHEDLQRRNVDLHKLKRSLVVISKQMQFLRSSVQFICLDLSLLCRGLKEDPNCPQMRVNWVGH